MKKKALGVAILGVMVAALVAVLFAVGGATQQRRRDDGGLRIVTTNFPAYDFARAVTQDMNGAEVRMLVKPGAETHDFEPTPQDIIDIEQSDAFIYVGGESDEWINEILDDINPGKTKTMKMMDMVKVVEEEKVEGMEEVEDDGEAEHQSNVTSREDSSTEYDEHVWTSLRNAEEIVKRIAEELATIKPERREEFMKNAANYIAMLEEIDRDIVNVVNAAKRKELIFGDRFPLRYFVDDYNLEYYAAFLGCSEQTEASAQTVAFLVEKVQSDKIPVVLKIELSGGMIAEKIAETTEARVMTFQAGHNISREDFEAGKTYAEIMRENVKVLQEALN